MRHQHALGVFVSLWSSLTCPEFKTLSIILLYHVFNKVYIQIYIVDPDLPPSMDNLSMNSHSKRAKSTARLQIIVILVSLLCRNLPLLDQGPTPYIEPSG